MRDYLTEMLYALTSAYSHKDYGNRKRGEPVETNIGKLFSIFAWGLDMVHEQAELIKLWDNLDYACGSVLDRYGANFGVKRVSDDDAFYRLLIKVKVLAQLSGGDTDTVINAAAELLDVGLSDVLLEDVFPAKIALYVDQSILSEDRMRLIEPIAWAIKRILAAGVGMRLYLRAYRTFKYDLPISRGGAIGTFSDFEPIGEKREMRTDLKVGYSGNLRSGLSSSHVGDDKLFKSNVVNVGGVYMRTHIKPRRIEY
ncbi:MAG: hypothetical protein OSJ54_06140 [Oscillospiraceae bacterium]|nr:hypothetical protein [Oscillospiraceae bacterium]